MTVLLEMNPHRESSTATPSNWFAARETIEDAAEDAGLLAPDDRVTCPVHHRWLHRCVASPLHINAITRHRWCRSCARALTVAVDELGHTVSMRCPGCGDGSSAATARMLAACRASLAAAGGIR